jgi:hypothetical protein
LTAGRDLRPLKLIINLVPQNSVKKSFLHTEKGFLSVVDVFLYYILETLQQAHLRGLRSSDI